jgi:puromycin-sensitive aminopeptidase
MASWTEQMGYPLLRVTKADLTATAAELTIEQSWFLMDGSSVSPILSFNMHASVRHI